MVRLGGRVWMGKKRVAGCRRGDSLVRWRRVGEVKLDLKAMRYLEECRMGCDFVNCWPRLGGPWREEPVPAWNQSTRYDQGDLDDIEQHMNRE